MTLVLSFDPGKNNGGRASGTGWCLQDEKTMVDWGVTKDLHEFLTNYLFGLSNRTGVAKPDVVVYETYDINPKLANQNVGKDLTAVQNIGAIKLFSRILGVPTDSFRPSQKPSQWKATGKNPSKVPKAHSHWIDAYNHGRYYLITHNLAPSALELEMFGE